jgi:hypothetical protein
MLASANVAFGAYETWARSESPNKIEAETSAVRIGGYVRAGARVRRQGIGSDYSGQLHPALGHVDTKFDCVLLGPSVPQ